MIPLPEILLTEAQPNLLTFLRPGFDLFWRGFGDDGTQLRSSGSVNCRP
jgi:hypothetical protein